jgi:hypothetical protein
MKIKVSDGMYVNSNTLFRLEWKRFYPVLVVHEKFEKIVKWALRILAFIGIATSVIAIDKWYWSLGLTLLIFFVEQFFERAIFEYTTMVFQPPPDFEIDYGQWVSNGFAIPMEKNDSDYCYFGPAYRERDYAIKFFTYLQTWIHGNNDTDNTIIVSLIIEPDEEYTTYIYANLERKSVDTVFDLMGRQSRLKKYGKRQQKFIFQMMYWNTLDFKEGYLIKRFLDNLKPNETFIFIPCHYNLETKATEHLFQYGIKKYGYKLKYRKDLKKNDPEYYFNPKDYEDD